MARKLKIDGLGIASLILRASSSYLCINDTLGSNC